MRFLILICLILSVTCDDINSNVVGGINSNIADHPHQLSMRVNNGHSCGASLISPTKAVCAAHCGGGAINTYSVLGGTTDRTVTNCGTCALRSITQFPRHSGFINSGITGYPNDISTLHFSSIPQTANTNYAKLAPDNAPTYAGLPGVISGWGRTTNGGALPVILQQGTLNILTNAQCASSWSNAQVNAGHICVQAPTVGACQGDSGGPLMVNGDTLAGATSWGSSNCNPNSPSVYTRLSYFYDWIMAN